MTGFKGSRSEWKGRSNGMSLEPAVLVLVLGVGDARCLVLATERALHRVKG